MTTTYQPGESVTLTVEWRMYAGGPLAIVSDVSIAIVPAIGGAAILASTSTGVTNPSTGINAYAWTVPISTPDGSYIVTWTGTDTDGDIVTAAETITVQSAIAGYTTLAAVKAHLGKITVDDRDDMIQASIIAASRHIDNVTGRWPGAFRQDATATARTFPISGRWYPFDGYRVAVLVDDISTASGMIVEGGTAASGVYTSLATFTTGPDNATAYGLPINTIYADSSFVSGINTVRITARWGWPSTPDEVELATRMQAARLYRRKDSPQGVLTSADWGSVRVSRVDPDVQALIAHLVIPGFA